MTDYDTRLARLSADQRALLAAWLEAEDVAQDPGPATRPAPFAPPTTARERTLTGIVASVLDVPTVGIDDDWFALGGDSVQAIVVVAHAEAAGLLVTTRDLLERRTVRALAGIALDAAPAATVRPPPEPAAPRPLTGLQEGMLYHALSGDRATYHVQLTCELVGELDADAFHRAWALVVQAHGALRTTFHLGDSGDGGVAYQRVDPLPTLPITRADWRDLDPQARAQALRAHLSEDLVAGFDLTAAPLLRLALFRSAETVHTFALTHHHLLLDGWSLALVLTDALDAYAALRGGRAPQVPVRPDTSHLAAVAAASSEAEAEAAFWRRHLAGYAGAPALPRRGSGTGRRVTVDELDEVATAAVLDRCRACRITPISAVVGACALVLGRLTAVDDVVIGTTVSGRSRASGGLLGAVGMFITTLPARIGIAPEAARLDWLGGLHAQLTTLAGYDRTAPADIARCAGLPAGALFDAVVVGENFPSGVEEAAGRAGLVVRHAETTLDEGIALVLEVRRGARIAVRAGHDLDVLGDAAVRSFLTAVLDVLRAIATGRNGPVAELVAVADRALGTSAAAERAALRRDAAARLASSRRTPARTAE